MPESSEKKRKPPISWRPPADRWDEFDAMVAASGLAPNAFITEGVFGRNRHRPDENQKLALILREEQTQSDAIRKVAQSHTGDAAVAKAIEKHNEIKIEIRSALFQLLGRKP